MAESLVYIQGKVEGMMGKEGGEWDVLKGVGGKDVGIT